MNTPRKTEIIAIFIIRDDILLLSLLEFNFLYMKKGKFKLDILIKNTLLFILVSLIIPSVQSQEIIPGSERLNSYINKLVNKKIAVIANNTSIVRNGELSVHLIDTLLKRNIEIKKYLVRNMVF